jgi:hypothetical protein
MLTLPMTEMMELSLQKCLALTIYGHATAAKKEDGFASMWSLVGAFSRSRRSPVAPIGEKGVAFKGGGVVALAVRQRSGELNLCVTELAIVVAPLVERNN